MVSPEVGSGLPFWLPKGQQSDARYERYIVDKEVSLGYQHVYTPIMGDVELYKTSGHWDHYQEDMFPPMDMGDERNACSSSNELPSSHDGPQKHDPFLS